MRYAFAGDREISVKILKFLISNGYKPEALLVGNGKNTSHAEELIALSELPQDKVFKGNEFKDRTDVLSALNLDYIFGVHFPYIIPSEVLAIPKIGFLNLHPAYLPFNKGWHTPSWAIMDGTKYGATLHFMSEKLDEGDIIHQKKLNIAPNDTANTLYQKALSLEEEVFYEAFDSLLTLKPAATKQLGTGTAHSKKDLQQIQEIYLDKKYSGEQIIDRLRGLTTNNIKEGAYFSFAGKRYFMQLSIVPEDETKDS